MHTRFFSLRPLAAVAALIGAAVVSVGAQQLASPPPAQPREVFRSSVDVVTIQASVRDGRGRSLSGLTAADFEVRDNGQLRPVLSLRSDQRSPLSLAFLVDMSGSMRVGPKIDDDAPGVRSDVVAAWRTQRRGGPLHLRLGAA